MLKLRKFLKGFFPWRSSGAQNPNFEPRAAIAAFFVQQLEPFIFIILIIIMATYEDNVEFIGAIISIGRAISQVEAAFDVISPYLTEYFEKREHYQQAYVREWFISKLSFALPDNERLWFEQSSEFKNRHNLTEDQKSIRDNGKRIRARLVRWYNKIGNMQYGIELPNMPPSPEQPPGKY